MGDSENLSPYFLRLLETALDCGMKESEYWHSSPQEVYNIILSFNRRKERETKDALSRNYEMALLFSRGVAHAFNPANKIPTLAELYPSLFSIEEEKEAEQKQRDDLSVKRFLQFAQLHNQKYKNGGDKANE